MTDKKNKETKPQYVRKKQNTYCFVCEKKTKR